MELTPKENEEANDYYGMNFNVTVWCRGQMCAKLWGKLYDENLVYSCGMDILNAADPFGREEVALAEAGQDPAPCDEYPDPGGGNLADAGGGNWRRCGGRQ